MKKIILLFFLVLLTCLNINSQTIYMCDFEDDAENQQWDLRNIVNPGLTYVNLWHIDKAINNGGERSMYISNDNGQTPSYSVGSMMISSRNLELEPGDYELSFDWLTGSAGGSDALFVAWVPKDVNTISSPNYAKARFLDTYGLSSDPSLAPGMDSLQGASWKTSVFPINNHDGSEHKLVFVWMNNTNSSDNKGACIDNIMIFPKGLCDAPEDLELTYKDNSVIFSWSGDAPQYEVKYYSYETGRWVTYSNLTSNSITLHNITEGIYDFYVRSICDSYHSRWTSKNMLVYLAALRCIDYLNLTDNNCWIGTTSQNKERRQKVDLGSDNKLSRHTIHTAQGEYDPRTDNKLPTVPPGELASVRLGNWNTGAEAECIEYSFTVDASNAAVLMMKYAVIMDEPSSPHAYDAQSSFELKILRGNAEIACAKADFRANYDTDDDSWHETSHNVWWKEWTTIGVNLKEYDGETLTIRVTTRDCTASGHFGYAYFTLSCSDGKMDGIGCGDNPTTNFIAPEGFKYKWYLPDNENDILSTSQTFDVDPTDTLTYYCDVIFPRNENCYFTLTASAVPRYPVAETSYEISHDNCMNLVSFENTSHVMTVNQITEDSTHTTTFCDWVEWDFGDGKISDQYSPIHEFPLDGGTYTIKMKTGISICVDSVEFTIELPRLGSTFDTITEYACLGSPYELPSGRQVWGSGFYNDTVPSELYDCHDVYVYSLNFGSASNVEIWDTICSGESYYFNGSYYTSSGVHRLENRNIFGCDSSTVLYLTVTEALQIQLEETDIYVCQDADIIEIPYTILSGKVSSYYLNFTHGLENMSGIAQSPLVIPISDMPPGNYPAVLVFFDEECGNDTISLTLHVQYPFSIVAQRWNDVLAVKSQAHNGGYLFSSYQWYKDNLPIEGANKSYLFEPAGLNMEALYSVELIRTGETEKVMTCGFLPQSLDVDFELSETQSAAGGSYRITSSQSGTSRIYSLTGVVVSKESFSAGVNKINAPQTQGYYILQIKFEDNSEKTFQINVSN